jgi:UbiD family decarboxylase
MFKDLSENQRKEIIVVDDDIDPSNMSDVLWALATRWDPATQTDIIADCSGMASDPLVTPLKGKMATLSPHEPTLRL